MLWKGILYAAPPVGELLAGAPEPVRTGTACDPAVIRRPILPTPEA